MGRALFTFFSIAAAFLLGGLGLASALAGLFRKPWRRRAAWALASNSALIALLGAALLLHGSWREAIRRDEDAARRASLSPPDLLREALLDARWPLEERHRRARDAIARGASIDGRLANGWTFLMLAVTGADVESVRLILDLGADVHLAQEAGLTALHFAAQAGNLPVARLLLDRGADPQAITRQGETPLDLARKGDLPGHRDVVDALLKASSRDSPPVSGPRRPNLVLFLADDLGWADCSLNGGPIPTPAMERLAREGMTFRHAFAASPSCAPSRAALLTGRSPARNGSMLNHQPPRADVKTWPAWFRELGYETAAIGKTAHYAQVEGYGFDHASRFRYHDDGCIEAAVEWLEARRARGTRSPLCIIIGTNWPHVPWPAAAGQGQEPPALPPTQVDTPETRAARARYAAAVERADRDLGLIHDAARRTLGEDTLFVFSSDHGAQFPSGKWNLSDAGLRVPLVVAWPGRIAPGARSEAMVSWIDLLPTFLEAAGGAPPPAGDLDGRSFLPVLRGERTEHRQRIFATHSGDGRMNRYPMRSVRSREWRYVRNLDPSREFHSHVDLVDDERYWASWPARAASDPAAAALVDRYFRRPAEELYDLGADPWELRNLAADPAHAGTLAGLRADLDGWMREEGDAGLETERALPEVLPGGARRAPERPHVILVLADDLGPGDLGCYGGEVAPTPAIDRLAREGTRFTRYYSASPICSPSRAGIITGRFPGAARITSFLQTREGNRGCGQADFLDPAEPSLPRTLKAAGYATAHFGKWHLGGGRDVADAPPFSAYGYDEHAGTWESPQPHPDITASDWIWSDQDPVKRWERSGFFVDRTLDFLSRNRDRPCFVTLWLDDPHTPWVPAAGADRAQSPENLRGVLVELDRQVGRLLGGLREKGLEGRTLVLFLSDNGPLPTLGGARSGGLRGSKLSLYEEASACPASLAGPAGSPRGASTGRASSPRSTSSPPSLAWPAPRSPRAPASTARTRARRSTGSRSGGRGPSSGSTGGTIAGSSSRRGRVTAALRWPSSMAARSSS
jgi:uncharacterized sulfatase